MLAKFGVFIVVKALLCLDHVSNFCNHFVFFRCIKGLQSTTLKNQYPACLMVCFGKSYLQCYDDRKKYERTNMTMTVIREYKIGLVSIEKPGKLE